MGSGQGFKGPEAEITKAIPMREEISRYKTREHTKHIRVTGGRNQRKSHMNLVRFRFFKKVDNQLKGRKLNEEAGEMA